MLQNKIRVSKFKALLFGQFTDKITGLSNVTSTCKEGTPTIMSKQCARVLLEINWLIVA